MSALNHIFCTLQDYSNPTNKPCSVHLRAFGYDDTSYQRHGFIKVNGHTVFGASAGVNQYPDYRGINTIVLNPYTCTTTGWQWFDTHGSTDATQDFIEYLRYISEGTILLGVTADEARENLGSALRLLKIAGVNVYDVNSRGKFAFVFQKGHPYKTAMRKSKAGGDALELSVTITGLWIYIHKFIRRDLPVRTNILASRNIFLKIVANQRELLASVRYEWW